MFLYLALGLISQVGHVSTDVFEGFGRSFEASLPVIEAPSVKVEPSALCPGFSSYSQRSCSSAPPRACRYVPHANRAIVCAARFPSKLMSGGSSHAPGS